MTKNSGFTLLEILIALTVFAILATVTSAAMYHAFNTRNIVNAQADRLAEIQLAISLIESDVKQVSNRPIRGNNMHLYPSFMGDGKRLEFTRDGMSNPLAQEKRSTLKRVALLCNNDRLIRRSWAVLDPIDHERYEDKLLIKQLTHCQLKYLNNHLQVLDEWREHAVNLNQKKEDFPKAVQLNITLKKWGDASLLFIIPEALYD